MKNLILAIFLLVVCVSVAFPSTQFVENSSASLERVSLSPENYASQTLYFDPISIGGLEKSQGVYTVDVRSNKGKYISSILKSEGLTFVVDNGLVNSLVDVLPSRSQYIGRIGCRIESMQGSYNRSYWIAKIFELSIYNNAGEIGRIFTLNSSKSILRVAQYGDNNAVEMLIKCCQVQNAKDDDGWTALMYAAYNGNEKVVKTLIKHGADVNAKTSGGKTALGLAQSALKMNICKLLQKAGARE